MPALDGIRGAAALCVIVHHAYSVGLTDYNFHFLSTLAVSLFFTLSGFLMAFLHGRQAFTRNHVNAYIANRVTRIAPLYLLVIVVSWLIVKSVDPGFVFQITNHNLLRHLLFSGSEGVFWSIPPEVQFYAFFILLWWSVACLRQTWLPLAFTALCVAGMLYAAPVSPGTTLPAELKFFLFGAVAGFFIERWPQQSETVLASLLQAAFLLALLCYDVVFTRNHGYVAMGLYADFPHALLCALTIAAFALPGRLGLLLFGNRLMRQLGFWSFGLYLLHAPFLSIGRWLIDALQFPQWLAFASAVLSTILAAKIANAVIEKPAQRIVKPILRTWLDNLPALSAVGRAVGRQARQ